ncbi:MAG: alcohol dehydrogenase catalytic domain-containing protein [Desulfobacterales bacterium]|nr:alcohol dehydrogenase catalytic domain-containing protein [Desulfobacterales bacterium]
MRSLFFDVSIPRILVTKALAPIFPAVYFSPLSPVRFSELPDPPLPGPDWVRVEPVLTGICGADLSMFFVKASPSITIAALPGVPRAFMGHEVVGHVVETGTAVPDLTTGDRVVLQRYLPCCSMKGILPPCRPCKEGQYPLCENFSEGALPSNLGAGFGNHFTAHRSQLVKVPDLVSDDQAVLVEPAAVSLHAVLRSPPKPGDRVLVIGAGVIGLNVIQFARMVAPRCGIDVMEPIGFKKDLARKRGADRIVTGDPYRGVAEATGAKLYVGPMKNRTLLGGYDLVYDCVGSSQTLHDALRWIRARGHYVMVGNQLSPVRFDQTPIWQQEVTLSGVNSHGMEDFQGKKISTFDLILEMIGDGRVDLSGFITHRFPLSKFRDAFRLIQARKEPVIKVVFDQFDA